MKNKGFRNSAEELTWVMFQMSEGNPYLAQELARERNRYREKNYTRER